jgi:hypothetical protein
MKRTKTILSAMAVAGVVIFMASCDLDFPYKPQQFVPPTLSIPLVSRDTIRNFLGISSYDFKLAFTNTHGDQALYVVDFSRMDSNVVTGDKHPKVVKVASDPNRPGYQFDSPLFSPDGSLVTYFLRSGVASQVPYVQPADGQSAAVAVAANGTDPHFWDSSGTLFVVYSDKFLVQINELPTITGFATYCQQIDAATGAKIGDRKILAAKPFNGGRSKNGRYLCTGYADGAIYDLVDQKLYRVNSGMQICNPAITSDTAQQDAMLFLPFSGSQQLSYASGLTPLGTIAMHEYLIVADKSNTVQWYVRRPADHTEWQDPDWTTRQNFVVALAKITSDDNDVRHDCYLIRRSDNAVLRLTDGDFKMDNTATPTFWISPQAQ